MQVLTVPCGAGVGVGEKESKCVIAFLDENNARHIWGARNNLVDGCHVYM